MSAIKKKSFDKRAIKILNAMKVPGKKRTYVLGCLEHRITIYSQQLRALNLAGSLLTCKKISKETSIGIIGGGISGITCAAAFVNSGCQVEVYEAAEDVFHMQSGNKNRYLHPNIYDWPWINPADEITTTSLPFFNWSHGRTDNIINSMLNEYKLLKEYKNLTVKTNTRVINLKELKDSVELSLNVYDNIREHNYVIYAGGFGIEKSINNRNQTSYWFNDVYDQVLRDTANEKKLKYAIIGTGDGGLTDCIRIAIRNFDQVNFFRDLINIKEFKDLANKMRLLDHQIMQFENLTSNDISKKLGKKYHNLSIPNSWRNFLERRRRSDISKLLLIGKNETPYSINTSIINRMLVFILIKNNNIQYRKADVDFEMITELEQNQDYKIIERIGPTNDFYEFFNLKRDKSLINYNLKKLKIGTHKLYDNSLFGNLKHEQVLKKILIILNKNDRNVKKRCSHFEVALERVFFNNKILPQIKAIEFCPSKELEGKNKLDLESELKWKPEIVMFMSSDLFYLGNFIPSDKFLNIIYFGEDKLVEKACNNSNHRTVLGLKQIVKWKDICNLFLSIPVNKIAFVLNDKFKTDKYYFSLLQNFVKNHQKEFSKLEIQAVDIKDLETEKNNFDLFIGRYYGHINLSSFSGKVPYASPYKDDIFNGAILSYDLLDVEIANILAEDFIRRILIEQHIQSCIIQAPGTKINLELHNASNFKIEFSENLKNVSRYFNLSVSKRNGIYRNI